MIMGADDINRRLDGLGLDFRMWQGAGGHWVLSHAGTVALFLGTAEEEAARDARFFLCGLTHAARHHPRRPDAVRTMLERLAELGGMPDEQAVELPGWILR